ncbi:helix-turn-helix domain-containing protein [Streptomyces sp. NPDC059985]|uniref:helix-turn-helix domain-containing protein n=1 Tax=Streptomyces sp. NPDC059985 TaxID=3347025 RepID=UPI0036A4AFFB
MSRGSLEGRSASLRELQRCLEEGRAKAGLDQSQVAKRAGLGRTTVNGALRADRVPSADTVAAIARVLRLEVDQMLRLRQQAATESVAEKEMDEGPGGVGRPVGEWDPYDLEVHPAGSLAATSAQQTDDAGMSPPPAPSVDLPGYVRREHDATLAGVVEAAAGGRSGLLVLIGPSSTGKTRACWEAVQILSDRGWRLWHPFDPSRVEGALAGLQQVGPRTVVWLNEAQHYLGDTHHGETLAAALRALLTDRDRGPVLVLGTLWPEYEREYSALPQPGRPDPYGQVRELLAGRTVSVPDTFDQAALEAARLIADGGDTLLAAALQRAPDGRVAQDLAGAPELLRRYRSASAPARCLLHAAMDARRLGVGLHLPIEFLADAAADYFSDHEYDLLADDWVERALDELTKPVHGHLAPFRRSSPRRTSRSPRTASSPAVTSTQAARYRLADYLEEHGRTRRSLYPPASFWQAAHDHITDVDDVERLGSAAFERHRLQWAYHLYALVPAPRSLAMLALIRQIVGDLEEAERLLVQACAAGDQQALRRRFLWRDRSLNRA